MEKSNENKRESARDAGGAHNAEARHRTPRDLTEKEPPPPTPVRKAALAGVLSALVVGGKFVLSFVPNVEIVTILLITFTCALGLFTSMTVTLVFCTLDMLVYKFSLSVAAAYFVYWPLMVCVFKFLNLKKARGEYFNAFVAAFCTALFGIITTAFDSLIFGTPFFARYVSGIVFYGVHIVSNFVIVLFIFKPLHNLTVKLKKYYGF